MKFERHHRILKELSISGVVKVSNLAKSLKVTKETIRSDLNELAGQGYLTRCHGGAFITLDSLDNVAKNEIAYVLEKYESAQKIKKGLSAMKNNVCVIGSFNVDIISYLPRLPSTGESLLADKFIFSPGGKGCNQALAASYADSDVHFITKVGSDHFSDYAINFINSSKIHKSVIYQTKETQTGTATIMVNGDTGDNVIAIYPGANMTISLMKSPFKKKPLFIQILFLSNWRRITKRCSKQFASHKKMTYRSSSIQRHTMTWLTLSLITLTILRQMKRKQACWPIWRLMISNQPNARPKLFIRKASKIPLLH